MHTSLCVVCGAEFQHKRTRRQYCSKDCGSKASYERRRDAGTFVRKATVHEGQCERCDAPFRGIQSRGTPRRFCSATCSALAASELPRTPEQLARPRRPKPKALKQCAWCHALHTNAKYCSDECRQLRAKDQAHRTRSPLRIALEAGDHAAVLTLIRSRTQVDAVTGCWEWQGNLRDGYPFVRVGGPMRAVHRLVIEATQQARLGSLAAHHMCANTTCVNPDHLQPVTYAANTAEMLGRQAYLARISELEIALAAVAPAHPALALIKCA